MPSSPTIPRSPPPRSRRRGPGRWVARRTPMLSSRTISGRAGGVVALKAENLQRTGSFRSAALRPSSRRWGTMAAWRRRRLGGQPRAGARRRRAPAWRPAEVFVPSDAPLAKVEAARGRRAEIHVGGESVDECLKAALARADEGGLAFVHPFDDPMVVAGQGLARARGKLLEDDARPRQGRGARRRRRALLGRRDRRSSRRGPTSRSSACRSPPARLPRVAAARGAGPGRLRADDRRRDRGQAPRRPHAAAARSLGRRRRGRGRGRDRRRRWSC